MTGNNNQYVNAGTLKVSRCLYDLVTSEITPGTGIDPKHFWQSLAVLVEDYGEKNRRLLDKARSVANQNR